VSKQLLAIGLLSIMYASNAPAAPRHTTQRGGVLVIETQFDTDVKVQAAFLTWQTYDEISREQRGMATAFHCDADVVASRAGFTLSCKVPLDVADGHYYLTVISIRTSDSERKYSWFDDLRADVDVHIKGGEEVTVPHMSSILVRRVLN